MEPHFLIIIKFLTNPYGFDELILGNQKKVTIEEIIKALACNSTDADDGLTVYSRFDEHGNEVHTFWKKEYFNYIESIHLATN